LLIGPALRSEAQQAQLLPKWIALPVFSSDPISSVAYATEQILLVAGLGGAAYLWLASPVGVAVVVLLNRGCCFSPLSWSPASLSSSSPPTTTPRRAPHHPHSQTCPTRRTARRSISQCDRAPAAIPTVGRTTSHKRFS
jgi:hypothetical protein